MEKYNKILVSGATGFVGSHLCKYLRNRGIDVITRDRTGLLIDVTDLPQLHSVEGEVEAVIHLAAKTSINNSFRSPRDTYYTNVLGTLNLLEFARQKKVTKFINISTYVYGQPQYLPIDERHPINPHSPYNKSKVLAEQLCQFYSHDFDMNILTLRPFYLYGSCPTPNSFLYSILEQITKKNGNVILSGKSTRRDFLFIDDFLSLIDEVLKKFPIGYNVYNVGHGQSHTLTEVSQILAKLMNRQISIRYDSQMRPGDIIEMVADISKISNEFSWKPSTSLERGLERTVQHYLSHYLS